MRHVSLAVIMLFAAVTASAAEDRVALAERYVRLASTQEYLDSALGADLIEPMLAAMAGQGMSQRQREQAVPIVTEELASIRPELERAMIDAAARTFNEAELRALIDFYGAETGVSIMRKMQPYMATYLAGFGPTLQQLQARIAQRAAAEIRP